MSGLFDRFRRRRSGRESPQPDVPTTDQAPHPEIFPSGIKLLHTPDGSAAVDIVFVHGLKGHRERTWTARDASASWPKALLPTKIPYARVLTFGYDASVVEWTRAVSEGRIGNHSFNLLTSLANFRDNDETNKRPVIFVCHSMGGLVCEDALVSSRHHSEAHLRAILESTKGIVFLGTPHHGSELANWAEKLSLSIGLVKQTNTNLIRVLRRNSEVLARIQDSFHNMIKAMSKEGKEAIEITCFYEELPLPSVGLVVPQDSAILPGYIAIGIRNDHHGMTKFVSAEDPGFIAVCAELRRWTKGITTPQSTLSGVPRTKNHEVEAAVVPKEMPGDVKGHFVVPFTQNLDFIGRSEVLERMKHDFAHDEKNPKGKGRSRVCIYGLGGVGKTQVALAYAYWLREIRPDISIFWVYSSSREHFQQAFARIAEECDIPGHKNPSVNILSLVKTWLQKEKNGVWFLVIDNADDPYLFFPQDRAVSASDFSSTPHEADIGLAQFIPECSHGSVLITTRNKQAGIKLSPGRPPIKVDRMTNIESAQMIRKMTGNNDIPLETALTLSNRLENLPLALAQASAFILENSIAVNQYLLHLNKGDESIVPLLSDAFQTTGQYALVPQAVMLTWMISFEQIQQQNKLASDLLSTMAFFDSQGVTRSMLDIQYPAPIPKMIANSLNDGSLAFERNKNYRALHLDENDCLMSFHNNEDRANDRDEENANEEGDENDREDAGKVSSKVDTAKNPMQNYTANGILPRPKGTETFDSKRNQTTQKSRELRKAMEVLSLRLISTCSKPEPVRTQVTRETEDSRDGDISPKEISEEEDVDGTRRQTMETHLDEEDPNGEDLVPRELEEEFQFQQSKASALHQWETQMRINHYQGLEESPNFPVTRHVFVQESRRQQVFQGQRSIRRQRGGHLRVSKLPLVSNITKSDLSRSLDFEKALGMLKAFSFISEGNDKTISVHRLVQLATKQWLLKKDLTSTYTAQALRGFIRTFPIAVYEHMGVCKQLLPHAHTVLGNRVSKTSDNVTLGAIVYENLARFYFNSGQSRIVVHLLEHALKRATETLTERHILISQMMRMLAVAFSDLGRPTEAKQLLLTLIRHDEQKHLSPIPQTLRLASAMAGQFYIEKRYDEAKELLRKAVETCDEDYPDITRIKVELMVQLAGVFVFSDDLKEAENLSKEVIDILQETSCYGLDHPVSLKNFRTQAVLFRKQGRLGQAELVCRTVLKERNVLSDHAQPYLLPIMDELKVILYHQSRFQEAYDLQVEIEEIKKQIGEFTHERASYSMKHTLHAEEDMDENLQAPTNPTAQVFDVSTRFFDYSHEES